MKFFIALFLSFSLNLLAKTEYFKLLEQFPETLGRYGSWRQGEIEIVTSPIEIERIEKHCSSKLMRLGVPEEEARNSCKVGIVSEDYYWIWVRDAVLFPGGIPGTYDRIIWKSGLTGQRGAVILPVLPSGKIVVNINFRHATRSWEMELPRGERRSLEKPEEVALRELREETGCIANKLIFLGNLAPESGVVAGTSPAFFAKVGARRERHQDESEAIAKNIEISVDEIRKCFIDGYTVIEIRGQKTLVYCRDPFLSFAVLQAIWRGLIPTPFVEKRDKVFNQLISPLKVISKKISSERLLYRP